MKLGQKLAGRYVLEELVGQGGMSSVYRARDTVLERQVAIKVLHEHYSSDAEYVERFRREARAIARLSHPNIVTVIDRGEFEGRQFIVFEHVPGETLKDVIEREGPLPIPRALALTHQIARALAFAHELGVVHRDVKPQNVLIDHDGSAKVSDFGVARTLDVKDELTESGTVLGTSDYIAPEQASGERAAEYSDQYSLGVVLYELLTGELPYPASNVMAVALRHLHDPVPSAHQRRPDVPARVDAIVARALAKRPRDRFASMEAMTAALEAALPQEQKVRPPALEEDTGVIPAIAGAPGQRSRPRPRAPRRSRRRGVALFLLAVGAVLAGLAAVQLGGDGAPLVGDDGGDGSPEGAVVRLRAVSDYDPEGGDGEHPEDVAAAADGDAATFWRTETYENFSKSGVGIVLRVPQSIALSSIVVVTDTPGYTARIQASNSEGGGFRDVSDEETVRGQTTFSVDTGGMEYRYYLLWITDPNSLAHVNEVHARTES